jgi:hypothetical protein
VATGDIADAAQRLGEKGLLMSAPTTPMVWLLPVIIARATWFAT